MIQCIVLCVICLVLSTGQPILTHPEKKAGLPAGISSISDVFGLMSSMDEYVLNRKLQFDNAISDISSDDYPESTRQKRSLFALGRSAVIALLKGTHKVGTSGYSTFYVKSDGYQRAVDDFYSVKPSKVMNVKGGTFPGWSGKTGVVGDRTMMLRKGTETTPPTLAITKSKDLSTTPGDDWEIDIIIYTKNYN